jgi:hypothetical protein
MHNPLMSKPQVIIPLERIASRIYLIRGQKVMLDTDLADLYRVTTGNLNLAVRRNGKRFPYDFVFQLTIEEHESLLLQTARPKTRGGRRTTPYVFTEQGVAMLSSVLRSARAAEMNVLIMRTFLKLREILATNAELARRVDLLDRKVGILHETFLRFMQPDLPKKNPIGFVPSED